MSRPLVRVVFALLVFATIGAFFVTQQLKSEFPLVIRFATQPVYFSPNGDGFRDEATVGFDLSEPATVSFLITDGEGNEVRRLVQDRRLAGDAKHRFRWDGNDDEGRPVPDGTYRMRVVRRDESRVIDSVKEVTVDREPPAVRLSSARPSVISAGEPGALASVRIRYRGPRNVAPEFRVFRTDDGPPRVVRRFRGDDTRSGVWDGEVSAGPDATRPAPEGDYAFTVTVRDRAGNVGVAPAEIPSPEVSRPGTGVTVEGFTLEGPLEVVPSGSLVTLRVGPLDRSFDFVLSRLGAPAPVRRGGRIGGPFRVRVPGDAETGVYLVRVRSGNRRAVWPLAVREDGDGGERPLVVLPALSWQGLNPVDDDYDGFADTLPRDLPVRLDRHFAGGGLPPRFAAEGAPLLRFLDTERLSYDLTTDLSLARGEGPALEEVPGVAFAGSALWLPKSLLESLRAHVEDGGLSASFGAEAFRRSVRLDGETLSHPSGRRRENVFGERTDLLRTSASPLTVFEDELGLFGGLTDFVGEFEVFEQSRGLGDAARALSTAGREEQEPAFVAYELGDGLVIRAGSPQWARELDETRLSLELPLVTKRIWRRLETGRTG
jgi:hypothetical protein